MKNKIIVIITFLAGIVLLNSCLKDNADYWKDEVAGKMYATVLTPTLQALSLQPVAGEVNFSFMVNIATDQPPTHDVTLTLATDAAAVTAYNTRKSTAYLPYPNVQILTPTVTILAGTRTAIVKGKVWGADKLNACDNFMSAITITSVSDPNIKIASNMKSYLLSLPINNPYAADYNVVGYRIRPGNPTEPVSAVETLKTVNCKTVQKNGFGNYGSYDISIEVTSNVMVVGGVNCFKVIAKVIDLATGAELPGSGMYASWTGDPLTAPAPPANPTDINYYNPITKTFVLNCFYPSSANRVMYEVLVRQ